ncbi:hypothetical protein [Lutispora sp.]|uniref:hypothetical protein n=1 Tax=Lutispora sp. TaxID=2828727 RepID=UPI0035637393
MYLSLKLLVLPLQEPSGKKGSCVKGQSGVPSESTLVIEESIPFVFLGCLM